MGTFNDDNIGSKNEKICMNLPSGGSSMCDGFVVADPGCEKFAVLKFIKSFALLCLMTFPSAVEMCDVSREYVKCDIIKRVIRRRR